MNGRHRVFAYLAWIVTAICISACQRTDSMSHDADPSSSSTMSGAAEVPSPAQTQAATVVDSPGKPLPPIDFKYELLGVPAVGQPLDIRVTSSFEAELDALNVALSGSERMQVPAAIARFRMARTAAAAPMTRTITVTPLATGTLYLNVLLQAEIGGRQQSRAVTIPIRVGAEAPPSEPEGTPTTDAEGQPIISLPASGN